MRVMRLVVVLIFNLLIISAAGADEDSAPLSATEAVLLANIAYQDGQYAEAARYYMLAARASDNAEAAENATRSAARADDAALLKEAGRLWAALQPEDIGAAEFLARVLTDIGELDEAVVQLDRIRRSYEGGADRGFDSLVPYLQRERNRRTAVTLMEKLVTGHEKTPAALYGLAFMQARAHMLEDALISIERALRLESDSERAIRFKSDILLALQRQPEALAFLKQAVERYDRRSLRVHYARTLRLNDEVDEAIRQYSIVVDRNTDDEEDYISLGSLLYDQKRYQEAAEVYQRLIKLSPGLPHAWFYLGEIAELRGDFGAALDWYAKVPESQFYVEAREKRAVLLAKTGELSLAWEQIEALRQLNYVGVDIELALLEGDILRQAGMVKEAATVYEQALSLSPYDQDLLLARANLAKQQGDLAYFEAEVKKLLSEDPQHEASLLALGLALADQSRYREARQYLEPLSKMRPDNAQICGHYGEVLWHQGEKDAARKIWAQGLLNNPQSQLLHSLAGRYQLE